MIIYDSFRMWLSVFLLFFCLRTVTVQEDVEKYILRNVVKMWNSEKTITRKGYLESLWKKWQSEKKKKKNQTHSFMYKIKLAIKRIRAEKKGSATKLSTTWDVEKTNKH